MAYTSVLPVHRLDRSIDYVKDRAKTTKSAGSLEEAIDYALNREKTEQTIFEDAMGCTCENAYVDMVKTKERFHKKEGVQGYHLVQSFAEGEVSPELAHLIGQELAEQLLKGQYEVVITTHLNTSHYHNHLVWNSVSMVDGRKYHSNAKKLFYRGTSDFRPIMQKIWSLGDPDESGKSHALCPVESRSGREAYLEDSHPPGYPGGHWCEFFLESVCQRNGEAGLYVEAEPEVSLLKDTGNGAVYPPAFLGKRLWGAEIREKILRPKIRQVYGTTQMQIPKRKLTGLQKLYYSYLYQMGVLPKRPKRSPYAVREDIRKLDQRIEQIEFLMKHDITTREQLATYREPLQKQISELMKERRKLYRNDSEDSGKVRLSEINEELKNLRKEVRMTVRIEKHSLEIEERLRKAEEQNQNEKRVEHKEKESQEVR